MNRRPSVEVLRQLRKEVGFGCPVNGCGNPYLEWHHFNPPWSERNHHEIDGMIALCAEHHNKADAGAFTKEQLQDFKINGTANAKIVKGRFDWMRHKLLAIVGGNFFLEAKVVIEFRGHPIIWFNRDDDGYMLLNTRMLSTSNLERLHIEDNFWILKGDPAELESPPSGKKLRLKYNNDDELNIEFFELNSIDHLKEKYKYAKPDDWGIKFPITAVELRMKIGGTPYEFNADYIHFQQAFMIGCFSKGGQVAFSFS